MNDTNRVDALLDELAATRSVLEGAQATRDDYAAEVQRLNRLCRARELEADHLAGRVRQLIAVLEDAGLAAPAVPLAYRHRRAAA